MNTDDDSRTGACASTGCGCTDCRCDPCRCEGGRSETPPPCCGCGTKPPAG